MENISFILSEDQKYYSVKGLDKQSITKLVIPEVYNGIPVKEITRFGFGGCGNLIDITIPNSIMVLNNRALSACFNLRIIRYNGTINEWNAITKDPNWNSTTDGYVVVCKDGDINYDGTIVRNLQYWLFEDRNHCIVVGIGQVIVADILIPETYINYPVKAIDKKAFKGENITSVTIPNSIEAIGDFAFYECTSLTSVTMSNNVNKIGNLAFNKCNSLKQIIFDGTTDEWFAILKGVDWNGRTGDFVVICNDGRISKDNNVIKNLEYILSKDGTYYIVGGIGNVDYYDVEFPEVYNNLPVKEIKEISFIGSKTLKRVKIPNGVTKIGMYAFASCNALESIIIPDSVTEIGEFAFNECSSLKSINISYGIKKIEKNTFENCKKLANVKIPNTVTEIGKYAFSKCNSFTSVTIPDSVISIGFNAFGNCENLTKITLGKNVSKIEALAFYKCYKLTEVYNFSNLQIEIGSPLNGYIAANAKCVYTSKNKN